MKARQMIEGASFDPTHLKAITKAFDDAWAQIAPVRQRPSRSRRGGTLQARHVVLSLAKNGAQDAERLTEEALKIMSADPTKL